ncbi:sugar phosphate isomerase/epimerase family protein [Nitrospirillum pindoramense]|uniref:Xylose isomerase-like TIM barrel protein n=1 Tax=Nitrospirillum amazonense TaxID=28077 RepID=A0A560HK82_9PROT|nr:TIM barrel protein [Nitrospirillum amazonense]TWB45939.1 xylose isomerase-like TIM barrel protein [Nitrospirillum amazonense]
MANAIKRGVSLYSYQEETYLQKMTLEDVIAASARMGALGIEVVSEQSFWGYPAPLPDATYDHWHALMDKYGTTPVCHDLMLDYKKYKGRLMPFEEQVASMKVDIAHAARLGCPFTRALVSISPEVLAAVAPYAEEKGVKVLIEVHAPLHFDHPWIQRHYEVMEKLGSDHLGFLPDMGIFVKRFPRVWKERFIRQGCPEKVADHIEQAYEARTLAEYVINDVEKMKAGPAAMAMVTTLRHNLYANPRRMLEFMHRIHNIHAKFYEMTADLVEPSIPYEEIIPVLVEGGYQGYLCSEYEGNRWVEDAFPVDSVEQVRRQQAMFERLLSPKPTAHAA